MILRFVQGTELASRAIVALEKTAMPFTPSHVEARTPDGGHYIGARLDGGVLARPVGYDMSYTAHELLLDLGANRHGIIPQTAAAAEEDAKFFAFLTGHLGEAYDWEAIPGFLIPEHLHLPNHAICSALMLLALRACGWLVWPVTVPAHEVDPRDLLLMISTRLAVPM